MKGWKNLTRTVLPSTISQVTVSRRLTDMLTSACRQPTEFSSVPLQEVCFVTGNSRSAVGQPTCTTSVDRQPTERSSVPFPVTCFPIGDCRSGDGQPLANRHVQFSQPTANRVQCVCSSRSVFCDRESLVSCRPTDLHHLGRPTANRAKFGSISRNLFSHRGLCVRWRLTVG